MIVRRKNIFSGKIEELDLNVTDEQLQRWLGGEHIQHVFPHLTPDEREFLLTGLMPGNWDKLFKNDED